MEIQSKTLQTFENYQSFCNAVDDMFLVASKKGEILLSNQAMHKKLGYTEKELHSMNILDLHPGELREEASHIFSGMIDRKHKTCPLPLMKKDGSNLQVETRIWFGQWDGEERVFCIIKDLSIEQESLQLFTRLFNNSPAVLIIMEENTGKLVFFNKAFLKFSGLSCEEALGKNLKELGLSMEYDDEFISEKSDNEKNEPIRRMVNGRNKEGIEFKGLLTEETFTSQGKTFRFRTMTDLTKEKEIEEELARNSIFQELLLKLASDYINCSLDDFEYHINDSLKRVGEFVDVDRVYIFSYDFEKGILSNTFEWCNNNVTPQIEFLRAEKTEDYVDWVGSHILGKNIVIEDVAAITDEFLSAKETLLKQGIISLVTIPMMLEDKCLGFVGFDSVVKKRIYSQEEIQLLKFYSQILVNIMVRKTHEEELNTARKEAEKANEAKRHFIAKTSHELRNPLNGAWGFLELLKTEIKGGRAKEYLKNCSESMHHAIVLANDLLDLSSIESNKIKFLHKPFQLQSLIESSVNLPYHILSKKQVAITSKSDTSAPHTLIGDIERIGQVLKNLISNAYIHSEADKVEVGYISKNIEEDKVEIRFYVKDNGIGIAQEAYEDIFTNFYKSNKRSQGTGLGLPISKELVEHMGGKIWLESEEGKGTTFFFTIPLHISKIDVKPNNNQSDLGNLLEKGVKILLAEDDPINQKLICEMLSRSSFEVKAVINGRQVLEELANDKYDLILMDIQMPDMDGLEATRRIRKKGNKIPIIALTASVLPEERAEYKNIGINGVVKKPVFREKLLKEIQEHLQN